MKTFSTKFSDITLGADPEYAAGLLGASPMQVVPAAYFRLQRGLSFIENGRHPIYHQDDTIKVIEDGVAFELTVPPAHEGKWEELLRSIHHGIDTINGLLKPFADITQGVFVYPTLAYDFSRWNALGPQMIMANLFGCDRDFDAFDTAYESPEIDAESWPSRYFGGHIHMSGHPLFEQNPILSIRGCAMTIGLAATAYSPNPQGEHDRTFLYGRIGKFRPQKYPDNTIGIEYRTPSTSWTDPEHVDFAKEIFNWAKFGVEQVLNNPEQLEHVSNEIENEMTMAIAQCDQPTAVQLLSFVESKF